MNRTLWAAVIAATALTATAADARTMAKHHRAAAGGDAKAQAVTKDLNTQQLASASGAGAPAAGPAMGSAPAPADAPAGAAPAPDAGAPMAPMSETTPPADGAAPADSAAPTDSTAPPR